MERVSIYIDAGNFYHLVLKKLNLSEREFDFDAFVAFLVGEKRKIVDKGKRYYVGTIREKEGDTRSREAMVKQTSLFGKLKSTKWELKTSKLRTRTEEITIDSRVENSKKLQDLGIKSIKIERLREKGIDVKLATDLIVGAVDDKYDTATIVSSDTDLVPAIDWVRGRFHKKIEYIGFSIPDPKDQKNSTKPLLSLIPKTDVQRTLTAEDLKPFVIKKRVFLVHRWEGSSNDSWLPWLKTELEKLDLNVIALDMPDPNTPVIENWVNYLKEAVGKIDQNTYFIGHSIGCQSILRYLESTKGSVGGVVLVAGWFTLTGLEGPEVEKIAKPWLTTKIDFKKLLEVIPKITVFLSLDDPYVPLQENRKIFEENFHPKIKVIKKGGHMTADDGYLKFPELLEEIKKMLLIKECIVS